MSDNETEAPWIITHDGTKGLEAYAMECQRCGYVQRFAMPLNMSIWIVAAKEFMRQHRRCGQGSPV